MGKKLKLYVIGLFAIIIVVFVYQLYNPNYSVDSVNSIVNVANRQGDSVKQLQNILDNESRREGSPIYGYNLKIKEIKDNNNGTVNIKIPIIEPNGTFESDYYATLHPKN